MDIDQLKIKAFDLLQTMNKMQADYEQVAQEFESLVNEINEQTGTDHNK